MYHDNNEQDENDLMSILDDLYKQLAEMPVDRPIFSDQQVMSFEDLIVGNTYLSHYKHAVSEVIVLSDPYLTDYGWRIKFRYTSNDFTVEASLADEGIIPYSNGRWNRHNYMTTTQGA